MTKKKEAKISDADKAIALENQYLKSQVEALKQMVEEERENLKRERETNLSSSQMDMQYQMFINRPVSPSPTSYIVEGNFSPRIVNNNDDLANMAATSDFGCSRSNYVTAEERRQRYLEMKRKVEEEERQEQK